MTESTPTPAFDWWVLIGALAILGVLVPGDRGRRHARRRRRRRW